MRKSRHRRLVAPLLVAACLGLTTTSQAVDLFWRTDGATGSWSGTNWSDPASATGGSGWTTGANANFTANSGPLTYVSGAANRFGNITLSDNVTVTVTQFGTAPAAAHIYDIGNNSLLTWTSQNFTASGTSFTKNGLGTWNMGAIGNAYTGGFTMNAGTVIVSGVNSFGAGPMTINGGAIHSSNNNTYPTSSLTIGGDFTFLGSGDDTWGMTTDLGSSTRTITVNVTGGGSRRLNGPISGGSGAGLNLNGPLTLGGLNSYTGNTTVNSGTLTLAHASSNNNISTSPNIAVQSGAKLDVIGITASGNFKLANAQKLKGGGSVYGTVTADAGSTIAPGRNTTPLTFTGNGTNITLDTNSTYEVQIGGSGGGIGAAGTDFDQIVVSGTGKSIDLGTAKLKILPMSGIVAGQAYRIVTTSGGAGVAASSIFRNLAGNLNAGGPYSDGAVTYNIAYGYGSGGYVDVTFSTVPEPSGVALLALAGVLFARRRRA